MIVRSSVVLPAPFRPTRQTTSSRADVEREPPENVAGLDVHVEVADREHQGCRRRPTTMSTTRASAWISAGVASARTLPWWSAMIRSE